MLCFSFSKAHCHTTDNEVTCAASLFWEKGFIAFQAAINAAIIEVSMKLKKQMNCKLSFDGWLSYELSYLIFNQFIHLLYLAQRTEQL